MLKSTIKNIEAKKVTLNYEGKEIVMANDGVIVCPGGILPTHFLKEIGVKVETKFGTA